MWRMASRMPSLPPLLTSARLTSSDWAQSLLTECGDAISEGDLARAQHLLWILNEVSSPYGSYEQRLAYYFMQALFCKMSGSGSRTHLSLCSAAERVSNFESMRKTMLKFQEASPWVTFGHVAANGAMMEAMEGESSVHIVDLSSTFCTQWPTLLEALATRAEGAPSVRLTTVIFNEDGGAASPTTSKVMEEVGVRLEKFARLMGVPFNFNLVQPTELIALLEQEMVDRQFLQAGASTAPHVDVAGRSGGGSAWTAPPPEMLAINCISALHQIAYSWRWSLLSRLQRLRPKIITLVEDIEAHIGSCSGGVGGGDGGGSYAERFGEMLRFYALYFEALEGSMGKVSSERAALERGAARRIMKLVGCGGAAAAAHQRQGDEEEYGEHEDEDEDGATVPWRERLQRAGFLPKPFSDDVVDDVRALLKRYRDGWSLVASTAPPLLPYSAASSPPHSHHHHSLALTWKDHSVVFASTWVPSS